MILFVNLRDAPPVVDQPAVAVKSWCVVQAGNGDRHLLAILESGSLRITSVLASFDAAHCELTTQSGRRYHLLRPPERQQLQLGLMHANALQSGLLDAKDISDELWQLVGEH